MEKKIINFEGIEIQITSKRMKNISLKITDEGIVKLSTPKYISQKIINEFLISKQNWLRENLSKINTNKYLYLGKNLNIKTTHSYRKTPSIYLENEVDLIIKININLPDKTKEKHIDNWYKKELFEISKPFFEKWEKILNVTKSELKFRKMTGKWGYCEFRRKVICLNISLLKKDIEFIEYVVLHELCHLLVPNHSKDFKDLLDLHMPGWRKIR